MTKHDTKKGYSAHASLEAILSRLGGATKAMRDKAAEVDWLADLAKLRMGQIKRGEWPPKDNAP